VRLDPTQDQADIIQAVEAWATEAAAYEKAGSLAIYKAAVLYAEQYRKPHDEMTEEEIARQVTAAGFPISQQTIARRLVALEGLHVTSEPSIEDLALFWEQYRGANNPPRIGGGKIIDPLSNFLHDIAELLEQGGRKRVTYAVSLLGPEERADIHSMLHEKEETG